ncbi:MULTISPECIES: hypothetical protein [Chryseobacterium]|uniref:Uncharacterized protein n=1 Tax=Chryseobacterium camelliae TaxID=1265445 RepID=A0ABU0TKY1_9FLAO|nr:MULTISPECIES: hypothetical protein [Chryseobacterium]MDT3408442.1 hypothetical protein [Pseudacidovorax intermedius]MDQ1097703.1 hypothetical protein [Chryseobacterium camelliae]MDQ1101634.1 hypothetical protein [Chryseobacterium sp. SORGH_AS_1048]MDR6085075.1 hypothetical protein [Chryseobacterium sp. SORGH_AS_0909]MDR6129430.1 hypothetical protein [Chryseobacterium sp. SORGH_AS_1175]
MKKLLTVACIVCGTISVFSATNEEASVIENKNLCKMMLIYDPIIPITSSCGYTEYIDLAGSPISCLEVEINRMEEECAAPVEGSGYAYNGYS